MGPPQRGLGAGWAGSPGTAVLALMGCLFYNQPDFLGPEGLWMGIFSSKRNNLPVESSYGTAFAVRECMQEICPELLILRVVKLPGALSLPQHRAAGFSLPSPGPH